MFDEILLPVYIYHRWQYVNETCTDYRIEAFWHLTSPPSPEIKEFCKYNNCYLSYYNWNACTYMYISYCKSVHHIGTSCPLPLSIVMTYDYKLCIYFHKTKVWIVTINFLKTLMSRRSFSCMTVKSMEEDLHGSVGLIGLVSPYKRLKQPIWKN